MRLAYTLRFFAIAMLLFPASLRGVDTGVTQSLHELFDRDWEYQMAHDPVTASELGDRRWNDKWQDLTLAAVHDSYQHAHQNLDQLHAIDRARLSPEDQVSYDVFQYNTNDYLQGEQYKWYLVRTNTFEGIQTIENTVDSLRFETVKDYDDWLGRMRNFPAYMDQNIGLMRQGIREHIVLPKVIGENILTQMNGMDWQDPAKHGFYKPFKNMPPSFSDVDKQRLNSAARQEIKTDVLPAFQRLRDFMQKEYVPASFEQVGAWQVPNGDATYAYLARSRTTTDLTPEEIHDIGLQEVKRIGAEMDKAREQAGFKGTNQEFFHFLRTDPRFYAKSSDELLEFTRARAKEIDPLLVKLFRTFPRLPYGVRPVPARNCARNASRLRGWCLARTARVPDSFTSIPTNRKAAPNTRSPR